MSKKEFKDQCDECGKFDYCKGFDDKILCPKCLKKEKDKDAKRNSRAEKKDEALCL